MKKRLLLHLLVWTFTLWCVAPFAWQIITSLKSNPEIAAVPNVYLPKHLSLEHYSTLFWRKPFGRYLLNSFLISAGSMILCLFVSSLAAYSVARLHVRGGKLLLLSLVIIALFPSIVFFFPLYELVRITHTANNPIALILPYVTFNLPFAVLVLTSFFRSVPLDVEEAAKLDGLSRLQILFRIIMPLAAPALATTGILIFIASWNEFLLALTFMTRDTAKTVTAGVASLGGSSSYDIPWGPIAASVVISTLPLILLVILFQRRIIQGLTAGASKG
ncbi:MAG TPA: carbohydrate ABC transporter permease [Tepidisphaeraceae bacterium]|jgi:multiple sugar transport system permease protein|nr:carbohydrate ABC transporter permease [Tepidisphaeraceae bacterium]